MRQVAYVFNQQHIRDFHHARLASLPKIRKMFMVLGLWPKPVSSRVMLVLDPMAVTFSAFEETV